MLNIQSHLINCRNWSLFLYTVLWVIPITANSSEETLSTGIDPTAQLPFWEWQSSGMSIRLVQRLPDQTRGYFMARGFSKQQAELIAQSCVFQTVFKNNAKPDSKLLIAYDLTKWRVLVNNNKHQLKLREDWDQQWQKSNVNKKARIAMLWSLLPTKQQYQAQDYNWGMTSFNLPPGTKFNLAIKWYLNGKERSGLIPNIKCAPDIHPEPKQVLE